MDLSRRGFLTVSSMALGAAYLRDVRLLAQDAPATKFQDLRRGAGIFTGRGGTIGWVITQDNTVVVDSQYPDTAKVCLAGLQGRASHPIDFLINTHHHVDHTAGNPVFRPAVTKIVAQRGEPALQLQAAQASNTLAAQVYPDTLFSTDWKMVLASETVHAHYYGPGHTGADIVVAFENAAVVHMGDLVWNRWHPFVDRPAGASILNWVKILDQVANEHPTDTVFVFGHGKASAGVTGKRDDLRHFRDYFTAVLDYVRRGMQTGKSKEEIAKLDVLPGFEDYEAPSKTITLGAVLGVAYDELSAA
ncbi:MAG TPA: MBL fold metallo-hydrolase [Vicinamibacterales bacterium]|nr:MBL fold metallo-hydrolase [Vicinamibacterales bacterium]